MTNYLLHSLEKTLSPTILNKISCSKVLVVGAGGIGCEILKTLILTAFSHVEVIDLDIIDISNLNRQFLFRRDHVGLPKCFVACKVVESMNIDPNNIPKYIAHHGNVIDTSRFNITFFQNFNIVFNALDNVEARRHVNRLCLAANVPLIEAGTTGYLGQVTIIDRQSGTECYECQTKSTPKVYPICTVRSTPSEPVHCIVWAKELWKLMVSKKVEDSMLYEDIGDKNKSTYMSKVMELREMIFSSDKTPLSLKVKDVLTNIYYDEILKQSSLRQYDSKQEIPVPINPDLVDEIFKDPPEKVNCCPTYILSPSECLMELLFCIHDARSILSSTSFSELKFNKDDDLSMRFVTASSNLRCRIFSIPPKSYYDTKGIAGNIVPAIATTNAIAAGLQVLQAIHLIGSKPGHAKVVNRYIYCNRHRNRKGQILVPTLIPDANPSCYVCNKGIIRVTIDTKKWILRRFLKEIIKKELGFVEPSISIGNCLIYEEGGEEGNSLYQLYGMNLNKKLENLPAGGGGNGAILTVDDFAQELCVDICIGHKEQIDIQEEDSLYSIEKDIVKKLIPGLKTYLPSGKNSNKKLDKKYE